MSKGGETLKQKVREDTVKQQVEWEREREEKKKRIEQYKRERELEEQSQSAMAEKNHVEKEPNTTPAPAPQASPTTLQSRASTSGSKTPPHTRSAKKVHPAPLEPTYDILQLSTSSMLLAEQVESDKSMVQTTCKMEEVTPAPFVRAKLPRILGRQSDVVDSAVELSR
ncbi:hypothetical protein BC829DRAFT_83373 [Chytridium lagenaria]|nr:hypothetical protein BC829DRAFT_83373 [Chytridium lagenaria]